MGEAVASGAQRGTLMHRTVSLPQESETVRLVADTVVRISLAALQIYDRYCFP